jgi:hypothetical protein
MAEEPLPPAIEPTVPVAPSTPPAASAPPPTATNPTTTPPASTVGIANSYTPEPSAKDRSAFADQPWLSRDDKGNWIGKGSLSPENIPGTPEYEVTKSGRDREIHSWVWDRAKDVGFYNSDASMAIFGVPASKLSANSEERAKQVDEAAWAILKVKRPEAVHNAQIVSSKLVPIAKVQMDADTLSGIRYPKAYGMDDKQLIEFVTNPNNRIPAAIGVEILSELGNAGYREQKELIGTGLVSQIRKALAPVDHQLVVGKAAYDQGPEYFKGLTQDQKRDAFVAVARYKNTQKTNIIGDGFKAGSLFVQDGVEAMTGFVDAVNPFSGADEYLSQRYRNDPSLRSKAEQVITRASLVTRDRISRLREINRSGNTEGFVQTLASYTDDNKPENKEFLSAVAELHALREDGAFAPGKRFEKLASFGSGVLNSIRNFKHFVADSTDPNSYLFNAELTQNLTVNHSAMPRGFSDLAGILQGYLVTGPKASFTNNYWERNSGGFLREDAQASVLDEAVKMWSQNWSNVNGTHDNVLTEAYKTLGMTNRAKEAKTAFGDQRLEEQVSMVYDPITLTLGLASVVGKVAGTAGKISNLAEKAGQISLRGEGLFNEGKAILNELKALDKNLPKPALDKVIDDVYRATGRTLTTEEAMVVAVAGTGEDMLSAEGKVAAAELKTVIQGTDIPEELTKRIVKLNTDAVKWANETKKTLPGTTGPKRFITGSLGYAAGATIETIPGKGLRKLGEFMGGGGSERALGKWAIRNLLDMQPKNMMRGGVAIAAGATWATVDVVNGKDWYNGAGLALFGGTALSRPGILTAIGGSVETYGKVQKRVSKAAIFGERVSGSPIMAALNATRIELGKTTDIAARASIEAEMGMLTRMVDMGADVALQNGFHVVVDQIAHGGTVGMAMAWANDQAAAGSGFGIGASASMAMSGLARTTEGLNRFTNETTRSKEVVANVSGILNEMPAEQAARVRDWLNQATGNSPAERFNDFMRRADSFRRAYDGTGGKVVASTPAEMAVANKTVNLSPKERDRIRSEAQTMFPGDPTAAAIHAEKSIAELESRGKDIATRDELQSRLNSSTRRADATIGEIQKLTEQINAEKAVLAKLGQTDSIALQKLNNALNNENVKLNVYTAEQMQLTAEFSEASRRVNAPTTFRKGETRTAQNGNPITMVRDGMYIESGPQGGTIHFDISKADAFTLNHEFWEAQLNHNAIKAIMPQLNKALWNKPSEGGRMSPAARTAFFDAYAASLSIEEGKRYNDEMSIAQKEFESTGNSYKLERFTREAMAWWMATIDSTKPVGYGGVGSAKGLTNVRGAGVFDTLRRITVGERSMYDVLQSDNIRLEFASMFDPEIGIFPRQYTASMVQSLRESGMRFVKQSDGTVRGFWLNNRGEIARDPVVNSLYDSIYRMANNNSRFSELQFSELSHGQQAALFSASGLSWLVDPATNTPIPGIDPPKPQAGAAQPPAGTPPPSPIGGTYNGQPIQPGVNPPPRPTPTPASQTPAGTPIPAPPPVPTAQPTAQPTAGIPTARTPTARPTTPSNPSTMPHVGVVINGHAQVIIDALTNIPQAQRGLTFSSAAAGPKGGVKSVIWGKPTAVEINALASAQGLPETVRNNMLMMAQVMAEGGERPILTGRYVNIFSNNPLATSEVRNYVGRDGFQYVSDRTFVPLYFESILQYVDASNPNKVLSEGQYSKLSDAEKGKYKEQRNMTAKVFNIEAFQENKNIVFSDGIREYAKDGSFVYLKDINGRELTAKYISEIFANDTEFFTLANDWLQHYNSGGPIDPTGIANPVGKIVEPSAIRLGNGDRALGESRLTVLRAAYGMTVHNGRIVVNPTTFTNQATRGRAFPFENMSISTMGELTDTGARSLISQEATTRGQFNMSPASWELRSPEHTAGFVGEASPFNTYKMWSHPNIPNTHIIETASAGSNWNTYKITVDGQQIVSNARTFDEAKKASMEAVRNAQEMVDARAYAEKVMREEAARRAKEQNAEDAKNKRTEKERTKAEAALLKEVKGQDSAWFAQAEKMAKLESELIAKHEAEVARKTKQGDDAAAEIARRLQDLQTERNRINEELKADIIRRSEVKLTEAENANVERTARVDNDAKLQSEKLRQDIEARSNQRVQDDADALAQALRSNTTELDVGEILRRSLKVDPAGLPVAGENRLVVRRVINQKPVVTQTLTTRQQTGPAVTQTQGNVLVARALGSPEAGAAVPSVNKYLNQGMVAGQEVLRAINDVWKTELGNQLHAVYKGLDAAGKPKYQYHLYGVNGQELYSTENAVAVYQNLLLQEQRLRGLTIKSAPKSKEEADKLQGEVLRQAVTPTYLQSQSTTIRRKADEDAANRYRNK